MYETFFGLSRAPFPTAVSVDNYFAAAAIENARNSLARCIERGEGIAIVIGPSGTGKTLLAQMLAAQFEKKFRVTLLAAGRFSSRRALYQAILYELGQPYRGLDEGEARLALIDFLTLQEDCPNGLLLIVDEAHTLPLRLIDEIRTLTNVSRQGQPQVRLVLAGSAALEERLSSPKLDSFTQRITARCYLEAFQRHETTAYVQSRVNAASASGPRLFSDQTCQTVHRATDGVPRLINQVCDHALWLAMTRGEKTIEPATVEEAWADLQQLPTPWNGETAQPAANAIEFGTLDDDGDPSPAQAAPAAANSSPPDLIVSSEAESLDLVGETHGEAFDEEPATAANSPSPWFGNEDSLLDDDEDAAVRTEQDVERIETMLSEVDSQFTPPAKAPEVELVFDDPHHPFSQRFAEEEIVADRYARPQRWRRYGTAQRRAAALALANDEPETVSLENDDELDEQSILIIEDGYEHAAAGPACRVAPVRRHEYRQLFTRLRKGG